jgi:hypothetical protein
VVKRVVPAVGASAGTALGVAVGHTSRVRAGNRDALVPPQRLASGRLGERPALRAGVALALLSLGPRCGAG